MNFDSCDQALIGKPDGSGEVSFPWGDSTFSFRLNNKHIKKIEAKWDMGVLYMRGLIPRGNLKLEILEDILRHGLLGGGMEIEKVESAIKRNFFDQPIEKVVTAAFAVLLHGTGGPIVDRSPGKAERKGQETNAGESLSQHSSESPAPSE